MCVYICVCVFLRPLPTILLNLTRAVSRRNVTLALFFHTQFYKKTKQLPILMKCCEEIQPHQWKPPVEREEHRLPFWLKVQRSSSVCQEQKVTTNLAVCSRPASHLCCFSCKIRT